MLNYALLGFLNYRPRTGYELKQQMDKSVAFFWHAKQSQIYRTLKTMEEEGLVISRMEAQDDRPDRRVYTITDRGQAAFAEWLLQPERDITQNKDAFLLKLFFSAPVGKEMLLTQLKFQRSLQSSQNTRRADEVGDFIQIMTDIHPKLRRDAVLWEATCRFGELYTQMYIRWLDETIELIEKDF
jgi:DNA-binding PadR family transcriptional regulator